MGEFEIGKDFAMMQIKLNEIQNSLNYLYTALIDAKIIKEEKEDEKTTNTTAKRTAV